MRWLDDVESDLKKMEEKGWKEKTRDREQWRLVVERPRLTQGCTAEKEEERRRRGLRSDLIHVEMENLRSNIFITDKILI
jgi:hypothetical protein